MTSNLESKIELSDKSYIFNDQFIIPVLFKSVYSNETIAKVNIKYKENIEKEEFFYYASPKNNFFLGFAVPANPADTIIKVDIKIVGEPLEPTIETLPLKLVLYFYNNSIMNLIVTPLTINFSVDVIFKDIGLLTCKPAVYITKDGDDNYDKVYLTLPTFLDNSYAITNNGVSKKDLGLYFFLYLNEDLR